MMKHFRPPPHISTGDPGSFAMKTVLVRLPEIVNQVILLNQLSEVSDCWNPQKQLIALHNNIPTGLISDPFEHFSGVESLFWSEEIRIWREEIAKYAGKPWIGIPWYFAEAYFYLRLLLAFGYYTTDSSFYLKDPFHPHKEQELLLQGGGLEIGREITGYLDKLNDKQDIVESLIFFCLWGNRIDLSNLQIVEQSRDLIVSKDTTHLLFDHSQALSHKLLDAERIDILLDNSGSELVCDLITACYLLAADAQLTLCLHTKHAPILVSDALQKDVHQTINAFLEDQDAGLVEVGRQLRAFLENQRLVIKDHYFWNGPLHFPDFPQEIQDDLSQSDLVVLKGDANYRRLLSDRKWPPSKRMEDITGYFPASFAVLRTMKGEIVVDLHEKMIAKLFHEDPQWMLNGKRGIIRLVEKR